MSEKTVVISDFLLTLRVAIEMNHANKEEIASDRSGMKIASSTKAINPPGAKGQNLSHASKAGTVVIRPKT